MSPVRLAIAAGLLALSVTAGCGDDGGVDAAGQGGRLLFSRFDETDHAFLSTHIAAPDGSEEVELTLPGPEGGGRWSHAGTQIAVMTVLDDDRIGTAIIEPDGTVVRVLEIPDPTLNLVCTVWTPDDSRLACEAWDETDATRGGIYAVDATTGGELVRITTTPEGMADLPGDWTPDGTQLLFKRSEDESPGALLLVDAGGGEPVALGDGRFEDPGRFSPDGERVLTSRDGALVVLDAVGREHDRITGEGVFLFGAVWSPDGTYIAYSQDSGGALADIYTSRADGSERLQVTDTPTNEIRVEWGAEQA